MAKLRNRARASGRVFAPLIFRLALRLEQIKWDEVSESASEAVFVQRSAQRLFKTDVVSPPLDTWLETEAAGAKVERDGLGFVVDHDRTHLTELAPKSFVQADVMARSIEIVRRMADESSSSALPIAGLTFGTTLLKRLLGQDKTKEVVGALSGSDPGASIPSLEYVREVTLEIATGYLEAGAAALLLLHEENTPDLADIPHFAALFNLAAYYDVPAVMMCRQPVSSAGLGRLNQFCKEYYVTRDEQSSNIMALPSGLSPSEVSSGSWLALSRWEVDPGTDPDVVHNFRQQSLAS